MLTEDLRARIAALNRSCESTVESPPPVRSTSLESLVPGEPHVGPDGLFYLVRRPLAEFRASKLDRLIADHQRTLMGWTAPHPELDAFSQAFPGRVLYLDLETCGFSGAPLFLIGLVRQTNGELVVEQLLARNYSEESAILAHLWDLIPSYDVLVTFNGKAFDWPFILDRSTVHRKAPTAPSRLAARPVGPRMHFDLLHFARRHWRRSLGLPNAKLQTLEAVLCNRHRSGDIPGHLIPPAYHEFVRSGDARQIHQIVHHNALDLVTLAQLSLLLVQQLADSQCVCGELESGPGHHKPT